MAQKPNTLQHSQEAEAAHLKSLELAQASNGKRDMQQVLHFMRIAAEGGHAGAQCNLGFLYAVGDGVEADSSQAIHWFSSAAELGDIQACYNLSQLYLGGHGVPADESLALQLLRKAANLGHPDALYNLGIYSYSGAPSVEQDYKAAFVFLKMQPQLDIVMLYLVLASVTVRGMALSWIQFKRWLITSVLQIKAMLMRSLI